MGCLLGLCAFLLFFLSDYNDWRLARPELKVCFPLGGVLLAGIIMGLASMGVLGAASSLFAV